MNKYFYIKAQLLYEGIKITPKATEELNKISPIWLMKDYITCSGVTLNFKDLYVTTVPNDSAFYTLDYNNDFYITVKNEKIYVAPIVPPDYMKDEIVIDDKKITCYINTYTDRIRIQLINGCANNCKFCNAREFKYEFNNLNALDNALQIGLNERKVRHALLSSGNAKNEEDLQRFSEYYEFFCSKYKDLEIDLMTPPRGFKSYTDKNDYINYLQYLKEIGIYGLSVNIELYNLEQLKFYCPEKYEIGQNNYFYFIEEAVKIFGRNKVRSLIIVGLEPLEYTLQGVEKLASIGCNPVLSPLFPYGLAQGNLSTELFIEARRKSEKICNKYDISLGPLCLPCSHNTL